MAGQILPEVARELHETLGKIYSRIFGGPSLGDVLRRDAYLGDFLGRPDEAINFARGSLATTTLAHSADYKEGIVRFPWLPGDGGVGEDLLRREILAAQDSPDGNYTVVLEVAAELPESRLEKGDARNGFNQRIFPAARKYGDAFEKLGYRPVALYFIADEMDTMDFSTVYDRAFFGLLGATSSAVKVDDHTLRGEAIPRKLKATAGISTGVFGSDGKSSGWFNRFEGRPYAKFDITDLAGPETTQRRVLDAFLKAAYLGTTTTPARGQSCGLGDCGIEG
ncbi:MAG: hypothetical protein V1820_05655 [archaeon]